VTTSGSSGSSGSLPLTPSQTVGPFLHIVLADPAARFAVDRDDPKAIRIHGTVTDGNGDGIPDAVVESWQADGLFGRCATDGEGSYEIFTRKPPPIATVDGTPQAPHLSLSVFARGLLDRVVTRVYFPDEEAANERDPTLAAVGAQRRDRLIATVDAPGEYRFDVRLQGEGESVFLAL
jgi:protocatechuate 3,4-dioxygenase alpha subunit